MRVLLIGGSGFIGRRVIDRLKQRGHDVIIFHRGKTPTEPMPGVETINGNRLEIDQHQAEIRAAQPDSVIDFLPWNEGDTRRVIDALNGHVEHVVHLSSGDVYRAWGNFLNGEYGEAVPLSEDAPLRSELYPYAGASPGMETYDKILAERTILQAHYDEGYPGSIIRLPMVYGPGDPQHRTWDVVKRVRDKRPFILLGETQAAWLWQRGYVDDVAFGVVLAAERPSSIGQVYNVGSLKTHTYAAWVRAIGEAMNWQGEIIRAPADSLPDHLKSHYNYQQHILYDTTRIRRELGYYEVVEPEEALRATVEWQKKHPPENGSDKFNYEAEDAAVRELA